MTDDKFILMGLDDSRSKDIAEVLGNKTCKKIIDYLAETKEASEKDISDALTIPINTVEYNLNKLIKTGLVEKTKNFFWSRKGKKIDMYKLAKKHIVISPKPKRVDMKELKAILPVIFIAAAVIIIAALLLIPKGAVHKSNVSSLTNANGTQLKQFSTYSDLESFLNNSINSNQDYFGYGRETMDGAVQAPNAAVPAIPGAEKSTASAAADNSGSGAGGGSASTYSHTNNQVEGVDEADIVKNDGKYIYTLSGNKVVIVNAYPANELKVLSEINFSSASNMFVNNDKLIVLSNSYEVIPYTVNSVNAVRCLGCGNYGTQRTTAIIYNIKDRENPILESNFSFDGNYIDSRMIGNYVYLISSNYANNNYPVPLYSVNGVEKQVPVSDIYYSPYVDNSYVFTTIGAINLDNNDVNTKVYLTGGTGQEYVSLDNIYLTYVKSYDYNDYNDKMLKEVYLAVAPDSLKEEIQNIIDSNIPDYDKQNKVNKLIYDYSLSLTGTEKDNFDSKLQESIKNFETELAKERDKTVVQKINIDKMNINYIAAGEVPGQVLNQFSMDEYNKNLRIATTTGNNWDSVSSNNVYVLDSDLNIIGKLEGIAPKETIYSARFIGNRAYLVTFRSIDPLFVVDLSSPTEPKVLGFLEIPGYSNYLHPYDETHVIGLGKDANESIDADKIHTPGAIYYTAILGLKVSLYDVSDVSHPVEVGKVIIGERGTDSIALTDHKAFLFDKDKGIIVLPVTEDKLVNRSYGGGQSYEDSQPVFQGAYVLNIDLNGISVRGKITHGNETTTEKYGPAKDEVIGAMRKDASGNIWTKFNVLNGISQWRTNASGYEGSVYSDYEVDSFPGGINYYSYFDYSSQIQRSLFMDDVLYTVSQAKIKANDLNTLDELNSVDLGYSQNNGPYFGYGVGGGVATDGGPVPIPMGVAVK